eukprot:TRINITY_DN7950_c1_g1_i1.p1 TRINITY_DN7950_c1_g1~~TRINITY_DN7950_c1_g1_i1.p1  ORF type:complete len:259 (+),score=14.66 TRINITY_DN7950_c1_g1_i1:34-810(+)
MTRRVLRVVDLGRKAYGEVLQIQKDLFELRKAGEVGDTVLVVEHDPAVVTVGKRDVGLTDVKDAHIECVRIERGGRATWHGVGQMTIYPIVNFKELAGGGWDRRTGLVRWWVGSLENTVLQFLASYNIQGWTCDDVGVWVGGPVAPTIDPSVGPQVLKIPEASRIETTHGPQRKIAAIGVQLSKYCSMHGIAININPDLAQYDCIMPCGLATPVTSLSVETSNSSLTVTSCLPNLVSSFAASLNNDELEVVTCDLSAI